MQDIKTITVIAPGLLGGSILLALRERAPGIRLHVWARRAEIRAEIQHRSMADLVTGDLQAAAGNSDLIILCTPIHVMVETVRALLPVLKPTTLVTDVGSVKGSVHATLAPLLHNKCHWIGSHPMAGSEKSGLDSARPDLFDGACCIVTSSPESSPVLQQKLREFWQLLGCTTVSLSPEQHDQYVAQISHLPHLIAALLVHSVSEESLQVAGPGFRDTSRVAAGPPGMWCEIFQANRGAIATSMKQFIKEAEQALAILENGDARELMPLLTHACRKRRTLS